MQPGLASSTIAQKGAEVRQSGTSGKDVTTAYLALEWEPLHKLGHTTLGVGGGVVEKSVVATLLDPGARQHKDLHAKHA